MYVLQAVKTGSIHIYSKNINFHYKYQIIDKVVNIFDSLENHARGLTQTVT